MRELAFYILAILPLVLGFGAYFAYANTHMAWRCDRCHTIFKREARFCHYCGAKRKKSLYELVPEHGPIIGIDR